MFYCFNQNNSGGSFQIDDDVAHYVFIEAESASQANDHAESIGIYFNGCADDRDCPCCGDRWNPAWRDEGTEVPEIYGTPLNEYKDMWTDTGEPMAHVYYADGRKETVYG